MSYFTKASSPIDGRVFSTLPVFIYETRRGLGLLNVFYDSRRRQIFRALNPKLRILA